VLRLVHNLLLISVLRLVHTLILISVLRLVHTLILTSVLRLVHNLLLISVLRLVHQRNDRPDGLDTNSMYFPQVMHHHAATCTISDQIASLGLSAPLSFHSKSLVSIKCESYRSCKPRPDRPKQPRTHKSKNSKPSCCAAGSLP